MEQVMSNPSAMDIGTEGATPAIIALDDQANFNPSPYQQEHGDIYKI